MFVALPVLIPFFFYSKYLSSQNRRTPPSWGYTSIGTYNIAGVCIRNNKIVS